MRVLGLRDSSGEVLSVARRFGEGAWDFVVGTGSSGPQWSVLIVRALGPGPRRFNDLRRDIGGISQRMLSPTLRGLERDGLVTHAVFASVPPRVDYALTGLGRSLWAPGRSATIPRSRPPGDATTGPRARPPARDR